MPIRPENRSRYPRNWPEVRAAILARAGHRCERCGVPDRVAGWRDRRGVFHHAARGNGVIELPLGERLLIIVLTVAHLDHQPENCAPENLQALCQRCHLAYDQVHHLQTAYRTRRAGRAIADLWEGL